jgi:hypothetical protein
MVARKYPLTAAQLIRAGFAAPSFDSFSSFCSVGMTAIWASKPRSMKITEFLRFNVTDFDSKFNNGTLAFPFLKETYAEGTT